ncbi:MAG: hypothetical protein DRO40_08365 [Thermoprotei archaeon]|nr:MAG: hypothetical protein DRO40_08365 [Thermoprotei archaeon]
MVHLSRYIVFALVIAILAIGSIIAGYYMLKERIVFNIIGNVSISETPRPFETEEVSEITINLNITKPSGTAVFENITSIELEQDTYIMFKALSSNVNGDLSLILSGQAIISNATHSYRISMPCLLNINKECYRVMMVIPGYDEPMKLPKGRYDITIILSWNEAEGSGRLELKLAMTTANTQD